MRRTWAVLPIFFVMAACGDPLRGIERVSELSEPLPEIESRAVLPDAAEVADDTPILAGLFRRNVPPAVSDPGIEAGLREAHGLDVIAPDPVEAETAAGVLPIEPLGDPENTPSLAPTEGVAGTEPTPVDVAAPQDQERRGVLGWLRRAADRQAKADIEEAAQRSETPPQDIGTETVVPTVDPALVAPVAETSNASEAVVIAARTDLEPEPRKQRGVFGLGADRSAQPSKPKPRMGPDARDVALGTRLPFGQIARVCDAKPRDMGAIVAKAARKGRGYVLYDSAPNTPTARTFYVTGFDDNCPRQFTASIALFGEPLLHEQLRYGLPARDFPYSATDEAYEKVKARVCNVTRETPCGPRISRLEKTTTFVSVYENFGENARWSDILLHEGEVLAAALKTP